MFRPRLKTRLGCAKCRARHKKCDERRPVCSACQKWDFPCIWPNSSCQTKPTAVFPIDSEKSEAFVTDDRDGMFWEGYQEDGSNDTRICAPRTSIFEYGCSWKSEEHRAFDFFQSQTSGSMSGCFRLAREMDIWSSKLLQGAHQNAGIRHAICALGALHQNLRSASTGPQAQAQIHLFAVEQYNKAIQCTVRSARNSCISVDESLVMCILFTLIERLFGDTKLAISHLRAGLKLLTDAVVQPKTRQQNTRLSDEATYISRASIIALLRRLERQTYQLGQTNLRFEPPEVPLINLDIPDVFSSLDEASACFEGYFNDAYRMMATVEWREDQQSQAQKPVEPGLVFLLNRVLTKWNKAFVALLQNARPQHDLESDSAQSIIHTLHLLRLVLSISLAHYGTGDEMIYDRFMPEFKQAVAHCVAIVNAQRRVSESTRQRRGSEVSATSESDMNSLFSSESLSSHPSVSDLHLPPGSSQQISFDCPGETVLSFSAFSPLHGLFMIAFRCRDPIIRRDAVQLLRDVNWCDAFWDSRFLSVVAERIVQIEENGYLSGQEYSGYSQIVQKAEDVILAARCHQIRPQFVGPHVFIIDYTSINPNKWVPRPECWKNVDLESFCKPGRIREKLTVVG